MAQISLTNRGIFVLTVAGLTLLLFLVSNNANRWTSADYQVNPDVVSIRSLFLTVVVAVEEAGGAISAIHNTGTSQLNLHKKPNLLQLDGAGRVNGAEVVSEADLVSNQCIMRRLKLLRPDFLSQIISEERERPKQASMSLAMANVLNATQFSERKRHLLALLPEKDLFLHLQQVSLWVDPLDSTQEFSENLLEYVSVMVCASVRGEPVFGVVHFPFRNSTYWSLLGGHLSTNLLNINTKPPTTPLRILISRSHAVPNFEEKVKEIFNSTPVEIIPAGGSGYKMLELALGNAEIYIHVGGARRWDLCAPSAILHAFGGVVRTMSDVNTGFSFHHNDPHFIGAYTGVFAAASQSLFDRWIKTAVKLYHSPRDQTESS